jgi:RNA polymerase subunit RPABC4/transcription elongation factor Spt4
MGASRGNTRRVLRRARRDAAAHWQGAAVITAVAATDVAYRLLMREPLRRALGVETKRA